MTTSGRLCRVRTQACTGLQALCAGFLLSACVGTRPSAPDAATVSPPAQWRAAPGTTAPLPADWWRAFGDPTLAALVERALANNTDIALAVARVEEARSLERLTRAQQSPIATIGANAGDARTDVLGRGVTSTVAVPQITASYDLDLFRRLSNASASARATLLSITATRDAVAIAVASTTASSYIALLGLDARLETTRATLAARAEALRLAQRRAQTGYTSTLELHQAESEYKAAAQLVPAAELAVTHQENALSILLGESPGDVTRGLAFEALATPLVPDGLPSSLLRRRPDLIAAEESLVASDRSLDSARAALLPNLSLTGSAGLSYASANALNPVTLFTAGATVLSPLFDAGRLRSQSDAAAAGRDQAAFAYRRAALTAFREVEDALAAVRRLDEQDRAVREQVTALSETLRIATSRYRAGYSPYLDQIDAQRSLLAAQLVSIQVRTDLLTRYVTLYQAMGGGWHQ